MYSLPTFRFSLLIHIDKLSTRLLAEGNLAVAREIPNLVVIDFRHAIHVTTQMRQICVLWHELPKVDMPHMVQCNFLPQQTHISIKNPS
jgi:hypothetical protein